MKVFLKGILAASLLLAVGATAHAQSSPISDSLTVYDPAGAVFAWVGITEAEEEANPTNVKFINIPSLVDPNQFGNAITLIEPNGTYSDIFGVYTPNGTDLFLAFSSDTEAAGTPFGGGGGNGQTFVDEGNGHHDATKYLNLDLQRLGYTAMFISDAANTSVPELDASALMSIGIAGLAGLSLRHRRRARKA